MTQPIPPTDVDRVAAALKFASTGAYADLALSPYRAAGIAVDALARAGRLRAQHTFVIGDRAATTMPAFFRQPERRVEGVVTALADDGFVTVEVEQPDASPMVITAPAADFVFVERSSRLLPEGAETRDELLDLMRLLFGLYETWWHEVGTYDPGHELVSDGVRLTGIASLLSAEDSFAMEEACDAIEPHETRIRTLLGAPAPSPSTEETPRNDTA